MSRNRMVFSDSKKKVAYLWVAKQNGGFFGADLFFSSMSEFERLYRRGVRHPLSPEDGYLEPVWVPEDFDDWDYIPDLY